MREHFFSKHLRYFLKDVLVRLFRQILFKSGEKLDIVGNPNRKKMHIFGFVGIFEYIC